MNSLDEMEQQYGLLMIIFIQNKLKNYTFDPIFKLISFTSMRYEYIQFAKGYAIFTIMLFHVLQRLVLPEILQKAIVFGGTGVHLFFLLSGFEFISEFLLLIYR